MLAVFFYFSPFFLLTGLVGLAFTIFCIVDIARRPTPAWEASGQNKALWLVLVIVGHFFCWLIMDLIYLLAIRPKVVSAQTGGGGFSGGFGGSYGGGQPYGGGQYGGGTPYPGSGPAPGPQPGQYGSGAPNPPYPNPPYPNAPYGGSAPYGGPSPYGANPEGADQPGGTSSAPAPAPPPPPPVSPPPGWYPDPAGSGQPRYWNGSAWS